MPFVVASLGLSLTWDGSAVAVATIEETLPLGSGWDLTRLERVEADPTFLKVTSYLRLRLGRADDLGRDELQVVITADASHFLGSQSLYRALARQDVMRFRPNLRAVEITNQDIPRPERDGWRSKVSRRSVAETITGKIAEKKFRVSPLVPLARELKDQLVGWRSRRPRPEEDAQDPDDLAVSVALALWRGVNAPSAGGLVAVPYAL